MCSRRTSYRPFSTHLSLRPGSFTFHRSFRISSSCRLSLFVSVLLLYHLTCKSTETPTPFLPEFPPSYLYPSGYCPLMTPPPTTPTLRPTFTPLLEPLQVLGFRSSESLTYTFSIVSPKCPKVEPMNNPLPHRSTLKVCSSHFSRHP